jgi:hypothetical protein
VRAEQLGVRNTKAGFDAVSIGLVADGDTAARLSFNTNRHDGDGLAAQFGAKFLFDRSEIGVQIDKQPIDRRIDDLYSTSRSYCSWVSKRPFSTSSRDPGWSLGPYLKIENAPYMALVIEATDESGPSGLPAISVAHYGEQSGDLMRDPKMCFELGFAEGPHLEPFYWLC